MSKLKILSEYVCKECGSISSKWAGKCPSCGAWSSLVEQAKTSDSRNRGLSQAVQYEGRPIALKEIATTDTKRLSTANSEFDRTLGGGLAPGSLVLIGGDPGIGKSTLVLQTLATMSAAGVKALYVSGEESAVQVKLRSERLEVSGSSLMLLCETSLERVLEVAKKFQPEILVIDSIQTVYKQDLPGTQGSVS